jgi:DNA helicase-2/ATP-dependent DNA helicase PcrA
MKYTLPTTWSPQQTQFIDWAQNGQGSCVLEAVAGSGKTTTVIAAALKMKGATAIIAFNKSIADEIVEKLAALGVSWQRVKGGTVHSFGFAAYRKFRSGVKVDDNKVRDWVDAAAVSDETLRYHGSKVVRLVGLAKQAAIGVLGSIEDDSLFYDVIDHHDLMDSTDDAPKGITPKELVSYAQYFLLASNHQLDVIDFNDMIYLPLLLKLKFFQYDNVFIDEAQDTNPARRALARAILKRGGRLIAVGDRHQAIYGFTGADNDSLEQIKRDFNAIEMPLTVTYRCPQAVVAFARQWVGHIQAHESAPVGSVEEMDSAAFDVLADLKDLTGTDAILCRLNKPLVRTAFALIRRKVPCKVEGRDIGNGLKKLATKWKVRTIEDLEARLERYLDAETTKLLAKKQEAKLAQVEDQVETLRVIADQCRLEQKYSIDELLAAIDGLFADNVKGILTLSSIHKSKGREWNRVFWLNRESTCPSPWARQKWQMDQEVNLMYVAATRAKSILVDLALPEPAKK